mgnify:CR=1 FL=1
MKRIRKLTPATLKRIIAEEKFKIKKSKTRKKLTDEQLVEAYLKCLKLLKVQKNKKNKDLRNIQEATKLIKKKLLKRL